MLPATRRNRIFLGLLLLLGPIFLLRVVFVMSGVMPGMGLFSNPPGPIDVHATWQQLSFAHKLGVLALEMISFSGVVVIIVGIFHRPRK
jgi:hypothetical protein